MFSRTACLLAAAFLLTSNSGAYGPSTFGKSESCNECLDRQREICKKGREACELRANSAYIALRQRCGSSEDCLTAAKEAFDSQISTCAEVAAGCNAQAPTRCSQCGQTVAGQTCDACVTGQKSICERKEAACKAMARAEHYIGLGKCGSNKDCATDIKSAYDHHITACEYEGVACRLAAIDGCPQCNAPQGRSSKASARADQAR